MEKKNFILEISIDPRQIIDIDRDLNGRTRILVRAEYDRQEGPTKTVYLTTSTGKESGDQIANPTLAAKFVLVGNKGGLTLQ